MELSRRSVLTAMSLAPLSSLPGKADHWLDDQIDWPAFLAGADLIWQRMPTTWYEGPFLGNRFLGSGIYAEPNANSVRTRPTATTTCR